MNVLLYILTINLYKISENEYIMILSYYKDGVNSLRRNIIFRLHMRGDGVGYVSIASCYHLSVVYQPGAAGFTAWGCMAVNVSGVRGTGVLCRDHIHDHRVWHCDIKPAE
jgi:hypothetical protein